MAIAIMVLVTVFMLNIGAVNAENVTECICDRSMAFCKVDLDETLPSKKLVCENGTSSLTEIMAGPNCPMGFYLEPGKEDAEKIEDCETIPDAYDIVSCYGITTPGIVKCDYYQS